MTRSSRFAAAALGALWCVPSPAARAETPAAGGAAAPPIRLELNRLEPREAGGGCRVWLVLNNAGAEALDPFRLDLVLFGRDGAVSRRLAVDAGPVPGGRTVVRLFDVAGLPCDGFGQMLLNDVLACGAGGAEPQARAACVERTALASRPEGVPFLK